MTRLSVPGFDFSPFDSTKLAPEEEFWRDHQRWLQDCGYMLRPRYMPDWKPSWPDTALSIEYEDSQPLLVRPLLAIA
jgi:hypothetical protein